MSKAIGVSAIADTPILINKNAPDTAWQSVLAQCFFATNIDNRWKESVYHEYKKDI